MANLMKISAVSATPLSEKQRTLVDISKKLTSESLDSSKSFCQSMIATATGGIGVYAALIGIIPGDKVVPETWWGLVFLVPPSLFLTSAFLFIRGFQPVPGMINPSDLATVERTYKDVLTKRKKWSNWGVAFLGLALFTAVAVVGLGLPVKPGYLTAGTLVAGDVGHRVQLTTGGPEMLVTSVNGSAVTTTWMSSNNTLQTGTFEKTLLRIPEPTADSKVKK